MAAPPLRSSPLEVIDLDAVTLARYGLLALAATIPLQRAMVIGALGSVVSLLAIVVIPLCLWAGRTGGSRRALLANPLVFAVALAWWAGATTFWSVAPEVTSGNFYRLLSVVAMAGAFVLLSNDQSFRLWLLHAYVLGSVVAASLVIWQFLTTPAVQRASVSPEASINQVAFTLVLALVPAAYLLARTLRSVPTGRRHRREWPLFAYGAAYSIIVIGVLLSGSRSGAVLSVLATVAAILMVVVAARTAMAAVKGITAMLLLAVALISSLSLTEAPPLERVMEQEGGGLAEEARAGLLARAWAMSADRPVLGAGLGTGVHTPEPGYSHQTRNPHNTHIQVFLELGAVGTLLWLLLILTLFRAVWVRPPLERLMWVAQLGVVFLGIAVRGFIFGVPMWFFLGIAAAVAYAPYRARASDARNGMSAIPDG